MAGKPIPQMPPSVQRHPLRKEIDTRILRGDTINSVAKWLKHENVPISRPTLDKHKEFLLYHVDRSLIDMESSAETVSIARAEGAAATIVNEVEFLNNIISAGQTANVEELSEAEKIKLGMQAVGLKQNILSNREDLQNEKRIRVLERLVEGLVSGELRDIIIGLKAEVIEERAKADAIDAEYTVKKERSNHDGY